MNQRTHPVGYRPSPNQDPGGDAAGPRGCLRFVVVLVALLPFAGFLVYLTFERGGAEELVTWAETEFANWTGSAPPDRPMAAGELESTSGPRTAVLPSGQIIEGDFEIVSIAQHLARNDFESAMASAIESDPQALRLLLDEHGVDPNLRLTYADPETWSHPLEKAVRQGSWETFQILLDAGADVNGAGSGGETALQWASYKGMLDTVDELLARGADPNRLAVADDGSPEQERRQQAHVGATALEAAASQGHLEVTRRLLEAGAELRYALHAAASSGSVEAIELFLERGADPTQLEAYGSGPMRYATMKGDQEAARRLLAAGARPGEQALREAAQNGLDDLLRAMADAGVRFDGPPTYWGPLYAAAYAGKESTVELLLELGASTEAYEGLGRPIDAAREQGHDAVVARLTGS